MTSNFLQAFAGLMGNEGGFSINPHDPGNWTSGVVGQGELQGTMWGVSCKVARANGYTGDMRDMPQSFAAGLAKPKYWDPYKLDQVSQEVAFAVFDTAYNGGHPATWLQKASGVVQDGVIGPKTLAAVQAADQDKIVMAFDAERIDYLRSLKTWPDFGDGWMARIANNLRRAARTTN